MKLVFHTFEGGKGALSCYCILQIIKSIWMILVHNRFEMSPKEIVKESKINVATPRNLSFQSIY